MNIYVNIRLKIGGTILSNSVVKTATINAIDAILSISQAVIPLDKGVSRSLLLCDIYLINIASSKSFFSSNLFE